MKRKVSSEPSDSLQKRPPRQDPVSCGSCRRKKLKCDRQRPCSSCSTRQLPCLYGADGPQSPYTRKMETRLGKDTGTPTKAVNVFRSDASQPQGAPHQESQNSKESLLTADWLEHIHMGDRIPGALSPQLRAKLDEPRIREDLEISRANQTPDPLRLLLSMLPGSWTPNENPATVNLISFLPKETDMLGLFTYYCNYINYLYHIIIPKLAEEQIKDVYRCVERGSTVNMSHLALLFAVAGCSLYLQLSIESSAHAQLCSQQFAFLTNAALTQANYINYPTIEGLQAVLVIGHGLSNVCCYTYTSGFSLRGSVITQAQALMLHRTDTRRAREEREAQGFNPVEVEIKRRLWWDIASFDWLLGFLSGPQEWTYLIHPEFMHVEKPSNFDDMEISTEPAPSTATPTDMTFFLERLKLAEVCKSIVDVVSSAQLQGTEVEYAQILELDRKMHQAQSEIPEFFRLDSASRRRFAPLYQERPALAWQRWILQQAYYSRLCRLHRPFFIRGARDPTYSYSHVIGLQSARKVLEIKRLMDEEEPKFIPSSSVIWSIMHHVFMAAVMLLLDVCYNWDDLLAEKRREEVLDACRMLSKAQQSSSLVNEGINAMMSVLQRHHICGKQTNHASDLGLPTERATDQTASLPTAHAADYDSSVPSHVKNAPNDSSLHVNDNGRDLEDIWSEILDTGGNLELENDDWMGLFTELTTFIGPGN